MDAVHAISPELKAQTHPPRYLMHKYWARKPHNIVRAWIERHSRPGDVVLDPFCGSGVTLSEAMRCGRDAIGCDLNPIAVMISDRTARPVDPQVLQDAFARVREAAQAQVEALYAMPCDHCGREAMVTHTLWERRYLRGTAWDGATGATGATDAAGDLASLVDDQGCLHAALHAQAREAGHGRRSFESLVRGALAGGVLAERDEPIFIRYACPHCHCRAERELLPGEQEARLAHEAALNPLDYLPLQPLHATAHQSVGHVHELFTRRNLRALRLIRDAIAALPDAEHRAWMEFVFSSALSQASRLVFVIERRGRSLGLTRDSRRAEVGSWTVPNYWVPPRNFEINAWRCFAERFAKVLRGKSDREAGSLLTSFQGRVHVTQHDSRDLSGLVADNSVDYVFTDPPYGDAIPYLGVSLMWATWLDMREQVRFDDEIHLSGGRTRATSRKRYAANLHAALAEVYRVLKPGAAATFCFNTIDPKVWRCLDDGLEACGFQPEERVFMPPARPSAKSRLSPDGSMQGDVLVTVRKPSR